MKLPTYNAMWISEAYAERMIAAPVAQLYRRKGHVVLNKETLVEKKG